MIGTQEEQPGDICPYCRIGKLVVRNGRYGDFLGCSRYPQCAGLLKINHIETEEMRLEKEADVLLEGYGIEN